MPDCLCKKTHNIYNKYGKAIALHHIVQQEYVVAVALVVFSTDASWTEFMES